jgi:hypothetical protein
VPIVEPADLDALGVDGAVVSNVNPAQVDRVTRGVRGGGFAGPVLRLWEPRYLERPRRTPGEDVRAA